MYTSDRYTLPAYSGLASKARHSPVNVWTLVEIATWVCRSGSPARESRWSNRAAATPRTGTCRAPAWPDRVDATRIWAWIRASSTAAVWAARIPAAKLGPASAHSAETDLGGEKVRSKPATATLGCEVAFAM